MTRYQMALRTGTFALVIGAGLVFFGVATASAQEDVGSTSAAVCCGADCCNIDGTCRGRGETNPDNMCEMCDPGNSQSSWSAVPGCGGGSDGGTTGGGGDDGGCSATRLDGSDLGSLAALVGLLAFARRRRV